MGMDGLEKRGLVVSLRVCCVLCVGADGVDHGSRFVSQGRGGGIGDARMGMEGGGGEVNSGCGIYKKIVSLGIKEWGFGGEGF